MNASETYTICQTNRTAPKPKCTAGNWDACLELRNSSKCPKIPQIELPNIKLNYGYCEQCNTKLPEEHQNWMICEQCAEDNMEQSAYTHMEPF